MDSETKRLDQEILAFIRRYPDKSAPEIDFEALALRIFKYQFARNPFYQKLCRLESKDPGNVKSWKEIPAMPTVGFKELVLAVFPKKNAVRVFQTSGTTQGIKGAHFFDSLKLYKASLISTFQKYLLPDHAQCRFFFLVGSPRELPHSSLSYMMEIVNGKFSHPSQGRYYVRANKIHYQELAADLRSLKNGKAMVLAAAFSLKGFLDFLRENKITLKLPRGSRLMETGGFKGRVKEISKGKLYSDCEKYLGIPKEYCVSEYGMTELSSQCYDTTLRDNVFGIHRKPRKEGPAWLRTVVIDPLTGREAKNGKLGLLRHFDLANRGSVMAIQTEDLGQAVGDGFELLGRAPQAELRGCSLTYEDLLSV